MVFTLTAQIHLKKVTRPSVHELERKIISVCWATDGNRKSTDSALKSSYRALLYKIRRGRPAHRSVPEEHPAKLRTPAKVVDDAFVVRKILH